LQDRDLFIGVEKSFVFRVQNGFLIRLVSEGICCCGLSVGLFLFMKLKRYEVDAGVDADFLYVCGVEE
jgi:hypothetical protein